MPLTVFRQLSSVDCSPPDSTAVLETSWNKGGATTGIEPRELQREALIEPKIEGSCKHAALRCLASYAIVNATPHAAARVVNVIS